MRTKNNILIVDDDRDIRDILSDFLKKEGYSVWQAESAPKALELLGKMRIDVMFLDLKMPGMDGFDLLQKIREDLPEIYICILTAFDDKKTKQRAKELGADGFIGKVFNADELFRRVELAISEVDLRIKRRLLAEEEGFHQIIGSSGSIQKVIQMIKKVAPTDVTVLIEGETGTGKGLVARAIHEESQRTHGPFAHVSCASFPAEILESEIFGHVKGSFTGAYKSRIGKFEYAAGGTLFLDEIAKSSLDFQSKMLRAMEEKVISRVGSNEEITVDVRIITATNRNLPELVEQGQFLHDLYHRINVVPIYIPPLRERREDIPILVKHFVKEYGDAMGKEIESIPQTVMERFCEYDYPGNIRELRNIIERTIMLIDGNVLTDEFIPSVKRQQDEIDNLFDLSLREATVKFEKIYLQRKIKESGGNKTKAAKQAKIDISSLHRKLKSVQ